VDGVNEAKVSGYYYCTEGEVDQGGGEAVAECIGGRMVCLLPHRKERPK